MPEVKRRTRALVALLVLAVLAAVNGLYLTFVHVDYEFGRPGLNLFCHALSARGCSVTAGRFGSVFGIPVSVVGFAGALAIAAVAVAGLRRRRRADDPARSVLFVLTGLSVLASVMMAVFSLVERSFCPFCLLWYVFNAGMFAAAWSLRDPVSTPDARALIDDAMGAMGAMAVVSFGLAMILGLVLHEQQRAAVFAEFEHFKAAWVEEFVAGDAQPVDLAGAPRKGPDDADMVIVEFSEFECPFCAKLWNMVEEYRERSEYRVQVVFGHFPLDSKCNPHAGSMHPHACDAAVAALCAERQGRFWDYGQLLFDNQGAFEREHLIGYARSLGLGLEAFETCLDDPTSLERIRLDIERGRALGVQATPTFFLNGRIHKGGTHPLLFEAAAQRLAADAHQSSAQ